MMGVVYTRQNALVVLSIAALVALIGIEVRYVMRTAESRPDAPAVSQSGATAASGAAVSGQADPAFDEDDTDATSPAPPAPTQEAVGAVDLFQDEQPDEPEPRKPQRDPSGSVRHAVSLGCSTSSVDGLSRQIIAQSRCIDPDAFVLVPRQPNLKAASNVYLYMQSSARDHLVRALRAKPKLQMTVNSALRTVAQQYLLRRWSLERRCGIKLASSPGESNHETGLALDIAQHGAWRKTLEAEQFRWLGTIDRVHFDFKGGTARRTKVDVLAFQQLWNSNNPDDTLRETGEYNTATERSLEQAPARGFPKGPRCKH